MTDLNGFTTDYGTIRSGPSNIVVGTNCVSGGFTNTAVGTNSTITVILRLLPDSKLSKQRLDIWRLEMGELICSLLVVILLVFIIGMNIKNL